jgi:hypothetical protein
VPENERKDNAVVVLGVCGFILTYAANKKLQSSSRGTGEVAGESELIGFKVFAWERSVAPQEHESKEKRPAVARRPSLCKL